MPILNHAKKTIMNISKTIAHWINQYKCVEHLTILLCNKS